MNSFVTAKGHSSNWFVTADLLRELMLTVFRELVWYFLVVYMCRPRSFPLSAHQQNLFIFHIHPVSMGPCTSISIVHLVRVNF